MSYCGENAFNWCDGYICKNQQFYNGFMTVWASLFQRKVPKRTCLQNILWTIGCKKTVKARRRKKMIKIHSEWEVMWEKQTSIWTCQGEPPPEHALFSLPASTLGQATSSRIWFIMIAFPLVSQMLLSILLSHSVPSTHSDSVKTKPSISLFCSKPSQGSHLTPSINQFLPGLLPSLLPSPAPLWLSCCSLHVAPALASESSHFALSAYSTVLPNTHRAHS